VKAAAAGENPIGQPSIVDPSVRPMPLSIPKGLTRQDVLQALADLDAGLVHPFSSPTGYELVHEGRRYAPKAVIGRPIRFRWAERWEQHRPMVVKPEATTRLVGNVKPTAEEVLEASRGLIEDAGWLYLGPTSVSWSSRAWSFTRNSYIFAVMTCAY
jgi:hypothetical protein